MSQTNGTPRARPHLRFANSTYESSPAGNKRFGTPRPTGPRRLFDRDTSTSANANDRTYDEARNIFRTSSLSTKPGPRFEPSIPSNTMRKVFAPAATPEPKRLFRDSSTKATPRRTLAESNSTELFKQAIPDPPADLSGAELASKVPEELNQKLGGSVYADQYLEHLCPKDFDHLQRRQFFCILDLRRLKYAATEIFAKKDWKLNVMNFAKEFEKSRSLILLRYGLYEFKNVKPSADIMKKWRRAHGIESYGDETMDASSGRTPKTSNKRKAEEDVGADEDRPARQAGGKRRAVDEEDEQPAKQQRTSSSATKTFLEKIASKPVAPATETTTSSSSKPLLGAKSDGGLARSVLDKSAAGGNIFGHLSDASKTSGADADGESETESEQEEETQQSNGVVNGAPAAQPFQATAPTSNPFASNTTSVSGLGAADSRESTPGRSLFDRLTKGTDGQPVRASSAEDSQAEATASALPQPVTSEGPADKTWTPGTPLKFAPQPSQGSSLFGAASTPSSSLFSGAGQPTPSLFGSQKPAPSAEEKPQQTAASADKSGDESDKENASQPTSKLFSGSSAFGQSNGTPQPSTASLFKPAPADSEKAPKEDAANGARPEGQKPGSLFENKGQSSNLFGASTSFGQSSTMFKNNASLSEASTAAATPAPAATEAPKSSLFAAAASTPAPSAETQKPTSSLFGTAGAAPAETPKPSGLFGNASATTETPKPSALFGNAGATPATEAPKPSSLFGNAGAAPAETPKPSGLFGNASAASTETPKPSTLFGKAGATPATEAPKPSSLFGKAGAAPAETPKPSGLFGNAAATPATEAPKAGSLFGNAGAAPTETPKPGGLFGATSQAATSNLFGGASSGGSMFGSAQKPAPKPAEASKPETNVGSAVGSSLFGSPMKQDASGSSTQKRGLEDAMQEDQPSPAKKPFGTTAPPVFFGGPQTSSTPSGNNAPAFSFGNTQSTPSTSTPPMFGGNTPSAGGINFNFTSGQSGSAPNFSASFGGPSSTSGFTFGASTPAPEPVSKSFTFGENNNNAGQDASNPFSFNAGSSTPRATTPSGRVIKKPNFGASKARAARGGLAGSPAPSSNMFGGNQPGSPAQSSTPTFGFSAPTPQGQQQPNPFGANAGQPTGNLFGGASTTGTSMFGFGTQ